MVLVLCRTTMSAKMKAPAKNTGNFDTCVHPRARTSGTKHPGNSGRRKYYFLFSQEAACKVQPNDRLHKRFGSTPVENTLRVFLSLEGGLQTPKYDRLDNVRIHPCCRELTCFFAFWKVVRKVSKNDRLRKVRIHPRCGDLACFFTFGKVSRTSKMSRGCAMYQLRLRSRELVWFLAFLKVYRSSGFL